jgi:uncharacterized protein
MFEDKLTDEEKRILLVLAREAMECSVQGISLPPLDNQSLTSHLLENGVCFVTLSIDGELRGCVGGLEACQPLVDDVREHAVAAALQDFRFAPVCPEELSHIKLEISRLTLPLPLEYCQPEELLSKLRPGTDGVVLRDGARRATFLPQVWEKLPDAADFLDHLCYKLGGASNLWQKKHLDVLVYQVEEFHE